MSEEIQSLLEAMRRIHAAQVTPLEQACMVVAMLGYDPTMECRIDHVRESESATHTLMVCVGGVWTAVITLTTSSRLRDGKIHIRVLPVLYGWPPIKWRKGA